MRLRRIPSTTLVAAALSQSEAGISIAQEVVVSLALPGMADYEN